MIRLLEVLPYTVLVPLAIVLAIAPFGSTPHLVEKWQMLFEGALRRPIDIFDFFLHTTPLVLLAAKGVLYLTTSR